MPVEGFYSRINEPQSRLPLYVSPQCGLCGLAKKLVKGEEHDKIQVCGEGRKGIMVIGEGPGENESKQGRFFVGKTGQYLAETLAELGVDLYEDCWIANAIRCRAWEWNKDKTKKLNRSPTDKEIAFCRPYLTGDGEPYGDIKRLKPKTIILLGSPAVHSVIGWLWKEESGGVNRWAGWRIPAQTINAWVCPTWHPSHVVQDEGQVVKLVWKRHLKAALSLKHRPWEEVPNYPSQIQVIQVPRQAAHLVREVTRMGRLTSIDIETDRRKPDRADALIWTCAVSNGVINVSFPWQGEAIEAVKELLASRVPKTFHNINFETRWFLKQGYKLRQMAFCSMLAAHVLDNRPGVTGLKFQSFALLGQPSYDDAVKPYFTDTDAPNEKNKIKACNLPKLLLYGGMDALMGLEVTKKQLEQLGMEL